MEIAENTMLCPDVEYLVDIRDVHVNQALPREERIADFVRQIRNPYRFKCGKFTVQISFTPDGIALEECIKGILQ